MRTFAIGDIHGTLGALNALLDHVSPGKSDMVVALGDYVDRGPDSAGVIRRLRELDRISTLIAIMGNHEQMMLAAREAVGGHDPQLSLTDKYQDWLNAGGDATLRSYKPTGKPSLDDVPMEHWTFLYNLLPYSETKTHIFAHASIDPDVPLNEQSNLALRWNAFGHPAPHMSGKFLVCGHTPQWNRLPKNLGHAICLDTGAYWDGYLSCQEIETGRVIQATESGLIETSHINDYLEK